MRLLITTDTVGGVWTYTKELSEGLLTRGHQVLLVSMGRLPSRDQQRWTRHTQARWQSNFHYLPTSYALEWMQRNDKCYCSAEPFLLDQIDRFCPDLLHLNQFCYGALPVDIPKIVAAHSDVISWCAACRGAYPEDSPWFQHYLRVVRDGINQADAVVAPTRWMLDALRQSYDLPACTAVIANGRDLSVPAAARRRKLQAVTMGRIWDEGKNVRLLEDVTSPMPLLVGGELVLDMEPPFCSSRLQLLGPMTERGTLDLFARSSVYVVTSLYEPFGLAPLEAALCGCAIVANDIPSLREVWGGSASYFKSASELTRLLHAFYVDSALLARAAKSACTRARRLYSQDSMVNRYLELYSSLGATIEESEPLASKPEKIEAGNVL